MNRFGHFAFETAPHPGDTLTVQFARSAQTYIVARVEPHIDRRGHPTAIITLTGICGQCGKAPIELRVGMHGRIDVRRCRKCLARRRRNAYLFPRRKPHAWRQRAPKTKE